MTLPPVPGSLAPRGLRGVGVRAAPVPSTAAATRLGRGGVRPRGSGAVPPQPRGIAVASGAAGLGPRLLGPAAAAAHGALLFAHRRRRPAPPLPIQPPGPPPGAGGQRGQRLGSTRGSASASGSLLRGWDAPGSLRGARAPGPRYVGSPARSAAPPVPSPARPSTASGGAEGRWLRERVRPPHMQVLTGPPAPGGAEGSWGAAAVSPEPSPFPAAGLAAAGRWSKGRGVCGARQEVPVRQRAA